MHKELIICLIVFVLIISLDLITKYYTENVVYTLNTELENFKQKLISDDIKQEEAKEQMQNIMNLWRKKYEIIAYYIEHDELEKVETELTALSSSIDVEEYDDGVENLDRCMFILNHIKNKYIIEVKNIF